ncbi:hypothetical protein C8A01DRAFT_41783 [Parachaetomium inaequale]|uniref:Nephrocystin 3-like N-terminal domain-containing protein n=1 Tax=Parachaetomium inaequale TaxID=2588326 RepID=A0AAN6SL76_9PEZI|nr:hypothetical protein C8A01DRAFT_41783 [Parachaetomium inaequale]
MLASLAKQLCARRPVLPQLMESLYEYKERGERPDAKTLEAALMAAMGGFSTVHIVIDAMDECPVLKGERRRLLDTICRTATAAPATLHMLCTSRKEADIGAFDALRNLSSVVLIRKALSELPVGLDATYDRLLQGIDPKFESQVASSLKWLALSSKAFRIEELAEIFILRPDRTVVLDKVERLFKPQDVLKYLSGLVLAYDIPQYPPTDSHTQVRLPHFSIREYLVSDRITKGPAARSAFSEAEAHLHIARSCLAYHLQIGDMDDDEANKCGPFLLGDYISSAWPVHLEVVPRELWPPKVAC